MNERLGRTHRATTAAMLAITLVASACGSSANATDESSEATTPTDPAAAGIATTDVDDTGSDSSTADGAGTASAQAAELAIDPTSRRLASLLSEDPGPSGWLVPAGRWTTTVFAEPVTFTTPVDLVLRGAFDEMLVFADPSLPSGPQNQIVLVRSSFIHSGSGRQPVPLTAEEVTATIESFPHTRVEATGVLETAVGPIPWWNMVVDDFSNDAPYGCDLGTRCGPISFTRSQTAVHSLEGETTTFFRGQFGDLRLAIYAVGNQPGIAELREVAGQMLASVSIADSDEPPAEVHFLGTLGTRGPGIPAGAYVALVGAGLLRFEVDEDVSNLRIQISGLSTWWITGPSGALGFVEAAHLIDPAADQLTMVNPEPEFAYVDPETVEEVLAWESAFAEILETGSEVVGGLEATWWESGELRTDNVRPCDDPGEELRCVTAFTVDQYAFYSQSPDDERGGRSYYLESADVLMLASTNGGHTLNDQLADVAPLLDNLTITPLG